MADQNDVISTSPLVAPKAAPKVTVEKAKEVPVVKETKVFNNHGNQAAAVKIDTPTGTDFVTVQPRGRVTLPEGSSVSPDYKNPNIRVS